MIKVRVLQVDKDQENTDELAAGVAAGHTDNDGWQMPRESAPGDLVVWYATGPHQFVARGWVEASPRKVEEGFGPYRGPVAGMQWIEPADCKKVIKDCGFDGGHQGYQTFKDEIAVDFLRSVRLLA